VSLHSSERLCSMHLSPQVFYPQPRSLGQLCTGHRRLLAQHGEVALSLYSPLLVLLAFCTRRGSRIRRASKVSALDVLEDRP